ncbi:MAG: hypothetical protein ACK4PR_01215, partial [Gammaproteobacteria bacterium]
FNNWRDFYQSASEKTTDTDTLIRECRNIEKDNPNVSYQARGIRFFAQAKDNIHPDNMVDNLLIAWLHPYCQRKGLLSSLWPVFKKEHGIFLVDRPSDAMCQFINKMEKNEEIDLDCDKLIVSI